MPQLKTEVSHGEQILIFVELKDILRDYCIASVSDACGVAEGTMYRWLDGVTRKPRLDTIVKVANALGYELRLHRINVAASRKRRTLRVVK